MENNILPGSTEKSCGRGSLSNGPSFRRPTLTKGGDGAPPLTPNHLPSQQLTITVFKDERGYGMKVSGDNPVYVQSVKEGGAAERAGLHSGDKIIKVNGVNVAHSTHTEVVELIKSASQVVLTVQHFVRAPPGCVTPAMARSPIQHHHSAPTPTRDRITGPQPVDGEKKKQVENTRLFTLQMMLEDEQRHVDTLRSDLAKTVDPKKQEALVGAERRVQTLQQQLLSLSNSHYEDESPTGHKHTHHRTKSNPDSCSVNTLSISLAEASKRLIASESMSELTAKRAKGGVAWDVDSPRPTPPGTPPPPYGGAPPLTPQEHVDPPLDENDTTCGEPPPGEIPPNPGLSPQPPIISMEEDEMSDQEMNQMEDHGPFKSLNRLWNHHAHLAVFMNYVISNSEPSSLLFYLVTELYKAGNAKEMKKWAYEIHSSFLVPCAPLRITNVDENIAKEVDEVLLHEFDKEEILRKIFWKARVKAKEDLNDQLADFQLKRTAGLGTLFGPADNVLDECIHDKNKELKVVENVLLPKLEPYLEELEKEVVDDRRFTTGAALGTVMSKTFGVRTQNFSSMLERCPTFVSKEKGLKSKILFRTKGKVPNMRGHHFVPHQYYTVTYCNHCQLIIWGIGPQGYQCSDCGLNIHRTCVKVLEESCPGPMTKKEKGNDRISKFMERFVPDNTKRKPSSLNLSHAEKVRRQQEEAEFTDTESGERPVSGSRGPDRRPDPVSEERERDKDRGSTAGPGHDHHDLHHHDIHHHHDTAHCDLSHHVTKTKPSATAINRSESYKERIHQKKQLRERRKTSDPNLSKSNNDVDVETSACALSYHSGSSSNSSLSTRSLESPSNSLEAVSGGAAGAGAGWDSDTEVDAEPPDWKTTVPEDVLRTLSAHEIKRQEVINELFQTERSHVRGLKVLDRVFFRPMKEQQVLPPDQISLLFANLEEMLDIHSQFNNSMKAKRKEGPVVGDVGNLLYNMFEGSEGEGAQFQQAAATFCARQQIALEALKEKRRKDPKLNNFLTDAEGNPVCRRLQLKDIIPSGMLRLTKYPLLLKNLEKYTASGTEEAVRVQRAEERSREILNFVNEAVKEAEDQHRLSEIQRRLDKVQFDSKENHPMAVEFKNLDLTRHRLIHEGPLVWRIANRPKLLDVHVLLLEDVIILLQRQDERYILKFYSSNLSPVIKMSTVIVRPNAVDKKALFLVNTAQNQAQIYDLISTSRTEMKQWFKHFSDAAEAYKTREGRHRRPDPEPAPDDSPASDKAKDEESSASGSAGDLLSPPRTNGAEDPASPSPAVSGDSTPHASPSAGTPEPLARLPHKGEALTPSPGAVRRVAEPLRQTTAESSLIEPSEVLICQSPVLTAEPVLTPLEKLRRTDEVIRQALEDKQRLVADLLGVPRDDYETIAELAAEPQDKGPRELLLAAVHQANQLWSVVSEALQVTEEEAVSAGASPGQPRATPAVSPRRLHHISQALNTQLSQLLDVMTTREEERERLREEVQRSREQLHALYERQQTTQATDGTQHSVDVGEACASMNTHKHVSVGPELTVDSDLLLPVSATPTTPEVYVDALSGEADSQLEVVE